jgi:hypothetical protein
MSTGLGGVSSTNASLIVLADFDQDGMADVWETQYGFNTNNLADASLDFDGDGMNNRDEYIAGTDPVDPLSLLKLTLTTISSGLSGLEFVAQSNIAYTIQYRVNLTLAPWNKLTNIGAQSQVRTMQVDAPNLPAPAERFYRVVTPPAP